jgi:hypothetical protein
MRPPKLAALYGEMEEIRGEKLSALSGLTEMERSVPWQRTALFTH